MTHLGWNKWDVALFRRCKKSYVPFIQTRYFCDVENLDAFTAFQKMLTLTVNAKLDDGLADAAAAFTKDVYAAANGDPTKVPTYDQLYKALAGRASAAGVESHHTATRKWAKVLLETLPQYANYTKSQWETLENSMPAAVLDVGSHRVGPASFTSILRTYLPNGSSPSSATILDSLPKAYEQWDPQLGPQIWAVSRAWLTSKGVP